MSGRVIVGVILLVLGVGFLAQVFTDYDFGSFLADWWPLILVFVGGIQLITRSAPAVTSVILLVVGVVLLLWQLLDINVDLWALIVALVLIIIGASLIVPRLFDRGAGVSTEDRLSYFTAFGGREERVQSQSFEGGSITSMFGGTELDLRGARLAQAGASLDVVSLFGGVELAVPPSWTVVITGTPLFGGWENNTWQQTGPPPAPPATPAAQGYAGGQPTVAQPAGAQTPQAAAPEYPQPAPEGTLRIKAFVMFGGFEVHN
jgi:predicted membrane protein